LDVAVPVAALLLGVDLDNPGRRGRTGELRLGDQHVAMAVGTGNASDGDGSCNDGRADGDHGD
jgi:hypothetical protein